MAPGLLGVGNGAQLRVGARAAVTCPPPPVLSGLLRHHVLSNTNQWSCRPSLLLAAIRREGPWPQSPSGHVLDENPMSPPSSLHEEALSSPEVEEHRAVQCRLRRLQQSHYQTLMVYSGCQTVICQPSGGKARVLISECNRPTKRG